LARVKKRDFELALMLWEGRPDEDPAILFSALGPFGAAGYRSTEVDAALDSLRRTTGPAERRPLLASLGAILARDQPVLFLYQFDVPILVASRVHGLTAVGDRLDLRRVWIDP
jgi:peptide/nickel transport system substrate-binding protein